MSEKNDFEKNQNQEQTPVENVEVAKTTEDFEKDVESLRLINIEILRAQPPQKVLSRKEHETLLSIKEDELTHDDKLRIAWATLRLKHHTYTGTDRKKSQQKKAKSKRRMANNSRKANR